MKIVGRTKKTIILLIATAVILLGITVCFLHSPLPKVNNTLPAGRLVTRHYTDEELSLLCCGTDNYFCTYQNTSQLAKDFKIECLRNPAELKEGSSYRPYIVLLGENGKRAFVMLDYPQERNEYPIHSAIICDGFMSREEMEALLYKLDSEKAVWDSWEKLFGYACGEANGNLEFFFPLAVKEGVVSCSVYHNFGYGEESWGELSDINFYPDGTLFSEDAVLDGFYSNDIWPYLPADKKWQ